MVEAITILLEFDLNQKLSFAQAVEVHTYEFDYYYQVMVNGSCIFETYRYYTYWRPYNITTGEATYEKKSFDGGTGLSNIDMVSFAILNYG